MPLHVFRHVEADQLDAERTSKGGPRLRNGQLFLLGPT
jgi:hypothetical protein